MNCWTKISEFCIYIVIVFVPKWTLLCALLQKYFFLSIFFLVINLKNYHLVSPPNPAEVCDVDFGFPTDHTLGRYQNTPSAMEKNISQWLDNVPFVGREHFHCNVDFEECLGSVGRLHFSHVKDHGRTHVQSQRNFLGSHRRTYHWPL